jgi:hypothetical protein
VSHIAPLDPICAGSAMPAPEFSICTLVTDQAQWEAMRASFEAHGFGDAEFLQLDNSAGNRWCAFTGLAAMIGQARGRILILCHQDVRLIGDGAAALRERLAALPPCWGIAGNAGATPAGALRIRITDPHGADQARGPFPARVHSLDENFLVLRGGMGIRPSPDLGGFHLYGTDLCLAAAAAGRSAWVIDFHLHHLSPGRVDAGFLQCQEAFEKAWGARIGRASRIRTTCTTLTLRAGLAGRIAGAWRLFRRRRRL